MEESKCGGVCGYDKSIEALRVGDDDMAKYFWPVSQAKICETFEQNFSMRKLYFNKREKAATAVAI